MKHGSGSTMLWNASLLQRNKEGASLKKEFWVYVGQRCVNSVNKPYNCVQFNKSLKDLPQRTEGMIQIQISKLSIQLNLYAFYNLWHGVHFLKLKFALCSSVIMVGWYYSKYFFIIISDLNATLAYNTYLYNWVIYICFI